MTDARSELSGEDVSRSVATGVWGLLLVWTGAALLLHWGWGVGLVGAGVILLGAQVVRRTMRVKVDGFGLVAGVVLLICGVGDLFHVAVDLFPVLFILAGIALLVSIWTAHRHAHGAATDLQAHSHNRA